MLVKISDPNARSLVEIDITFHPEAIRGALASGSGCLGFALRATGFLLLFYLCIGFQLTLPRYLPELWLHPLVILLAYAACRSSLATTLALATLGGICLDAGLARLPGPSALLLIAIAATLHGLAKTPSWPRAHGGLQAILAAAYANLLFVLGNLLFLAGHLPWRTRLALLPAAAGLGTITNALAFAPVLFFCLDAISSLGQPRPQPAPPTA